MITPLLTFFILLQNPAGQQDSIPLSGVASYYARKFSGRHTSNGELYSPNKYTCAHRSLPFGTVLKVTNPENCKYVWVKVNDRGPFHKKRVIDLSLAAAKKLGIVQKGYAEVTLELPQLTDNLNSMDSVMLQPTKLTKSTVSKKQRKSIKHKAIPKKRLQ